MIQHLSVFITKKEVLFIPPKVYVDIYKVAILLLIHVS